MPNPNDMPPGFKDRIEAAARRHVEDNLTNPTESDFLYTHNAMMTAIIEYYDWQRELTAAGHKAMEQPK